MHTRMKEIEEQISKLQRSSRENFLERFFLKSNLYPKKHIVFNVTIKIESHVKKQTKTYHASTLRKKAPVAI